MRDKDINTNELDLQVLPVGQKVITREANEGFIGQNLALSCCFNSETYTDTLHIYMNRILPL